MITWLLSIAEPGLSVCDDDDDVVRPAWLCCSLQEISTDLGQLIWVGLLGQFGSADITPQSNALWRRIYFVFNGC